MPKAPSLRLYDNPDQKPPRYDRRKYDHGAFDIDDFQDHKFDLRQLHVIDDELEDEKKEMDEETAEKPLYPKLMSFLYSFNDPEITYELNNIVGIKTQLAKITSIVEMKQAGRYIADYNPRNIYAHVTAVAGVKLESDVKHYIRPETSKFVNLNGDSWDVEVLKKKASDFVNGYNFHEHEYNPAKSKGTVLDVLIKESAETTYVDALIEVKDEEMKEAVKNGSLDAVSIGCIYSYVTCTQCGQRFKPEEIRCSHLSRNLRGQFIDTKGASRIVSELTGSVDKPDSVKFYEISWVKNPAFCGAVLWDIVKTASNPTAQMESYTRTYLPYIKRYFRCRALYDRIFYLYMCFMAVAYQSKNQVFNMLQAIVGLRYNRMLSRSAYEDYFKSHGLGAKEIDYMASLVEEYGRIAN